jgi:diketogulonate reductase-like aldo/keto reductase
METLVDDGKIRYIGVSNFYEGDLMKALRELKKNRVVSDQIEFSILARDAGKSLLDFYKKNGITAIAYSPFGTGALFGEQYRPLLEALTDIGKKYEKSAAQVALAWAIAEEPVVVIPKAGNKEHVLENIASADFELSGKDIKSINAVADGFTKEPHKPAFPIE